VVIEERAVHIDGDHADVQGTPSLLKDLKYPVQRTYQQSI
jgi:hypothetical protein